MNGRGNKPSIVALSYKMFSNSNLERILTRIFSIIILISGLRVPPVFSSMIFPSQKFLQIQCFSSPRTVDDRACFSRQLSGRYRWLRILYLDLFWSSLCSPPTYWRFQLCIFYFWVTFTARFAYRLSTQCCRWTKLASLAVSSFVFLFIVHFHLFNYAF